MARVTGAWLYWFDDKDFHWQKISPEELKYTPRHNNNRREYNEEIFLKPNAVIELFDIVITALLLLGYVVIILLLVLMCLAPLNRLRYRGFQFDDTYEPTFALIVPAHNEGGVIERTIRLFLETDFTLWTKKK